MSSEQVLPAQAARGAARIAGAARTFAPSRCEAFALRGFDLDERRGLISLRYGLLTADGELPFEELIEVPPPAHAAAAGTARAAPPAALEAAVALLQIAAGTSYYKAAAPSHVEAPPLSPPAAALANGLYGPGLAEFRHVNGLPLDPGALFAASVTAAQPAPAGLDRRPLVPVGGGKDSIVTIETLRSHDPLLFSIGNAAPIARSVAASGLEHVTATRRIDPRLLALNEQGALNGHVPVTSIVSLVACITALLHGHGVVALSNERSASVGSLSVSGVEVNHQWSKGIDAERLLRAALAATVAPDLDCFSLLRPASELAIARAFATMTGYHRVFTSCNTAFRLDPERRGGGWCGECPKCRFVFLILAPFMTPAALSEIFGGRNLLDEPAQLAGFTELIGHEADKPFECVGEVEESLAAFRMLAADERWRATAIVRAVDSQALARLEPALGRPQAALALADEHFIPAPFASDVRARLGAAP